MALTSAAGLLLGVVAATVPDAFAAPAYADDSVATSSVRVVSTTVDRASRALGTDNTTPTLGWVLDGGQRGESQTAYEVHMGTSATAPADNPDVWDSGKVGSADSVAVAYDGPALQSQTRYYWQVRVWDSAGRVSAWSAVDWWETGLLTAEDWSGASWIGGAGSGDSVWPAGTTAEASSFHGPGSGRTYTPSNAIDGNGSSFWNDNTSSGYPDVLTVSSPVAVDVPGVTVVSHSDGSITDYTVQTWNGTRWITQATVTGNTEVTRYVSFEKPVASNQVRLNITKSAPQNGAYSRVAELQPGRVEIEPEPEVRPAPLLRKQFTASKEVSRARAYVSGLGYYEMTIDGDKVDDSVLNPGFTVYDETSLYATHDVTEAVRQQGAHAIGVMLGRGFYGLPSADTKYWHNSPWLGEPRLLLKLRIDYTDGTQDTVVSDSSWLSHDGPTVRDSVYAGEKYDARLEQSGWDEPGFDTAGWRPAQTMAVPTENLRAQQNEPIRVVDSLVAEEITEPKPGTYVFRFPVNTAGWAQLKARGAAGTEVTLIYGEKLRDDGTVVDDGDPGLTNGKVQHDVYVLNGHGEEVWEPSFSYKGFQYVQVDGYPGIPAKEDVIGRVVHNDVPAVGEFSSSNQLLNTIHTMTERTILNNLHSVMTDTPLYEKRGWLGDVNVILPTTTNNFDMSRFYRNWLISIQDNQEDNGAGADLSPNPYDSGYVDPIWAGALVNMPYELYRTYGDKTLLAKNYESMTSYVDYLTTQAQEGIQPGFYGDWVSPETETWPFPPEGPGLTATAYYYDYAVKMAEVAEILGRKADAQRFAALSTRVNSAFNAMFLDVEAGVYRTEKDAGYRQTSNAVPLSFGLVPEASINNVTENLVADIESRGNHLNTGHAGTKALFGVLTEQGYVDTAYAVATQRTYPSYGYWIDNGATTLWEAWELDTRSKNHAFLGSVDDWFYRDIAGLAAGAPGWAKAVIKPHIPTGLEQAEATVDTVRGTVSTDWSKNAADGALTLNLDVPVNMTAEVHVPASSRWSVTEGGTPVEFAQGVRFLRSEDEAVVFAVGSGSYVFGVDSVLGHIGDARDDLDALTALAAELRTSDQVSAAQSNFVIRRAGHAKEDVQAAWDGYVSDTRESSATKLHQALSTLSNIQRWITAQVDSGDLVAGVAGQLQRAVRAVEENVSAASGLLVGAVVSLHVPAQPAFPGEPVAIDVNVHNRGTKALEDVSTALRAPRGWNVTPVGDPVVTVNPGQAMSRRYEVTSPDTAALDSHQLEGTVEYRYKSSRAALPVSGGFELAPPVTVDSAAVSPSTVHPGDEVTLSAQLVNRSGRTRSGELRASLPDGWTAAGQVAYSIPAGRSATVAVPITVPLSVGEEKLTLDAVIGDSENQHSSASVTVDLVNPPNEVMDHVDLGDAASEAAHKLTASAASGTNVEAGLTRRYTNSGVPGGWFEVDITVPTDAPVLIRAVETYGGPQTKTYDVLVDGALVRQRRVTRSADSPGTVTYQFVVNPSAATADGTVRMRFQDVGGDFDPSIADLWVAPAKAGLDG